MLIFHIHIPVLCKFVENQHKLSTKLECIEIVKFTKSQLIKPNYATLPSCGTTTHHFGDAVHAVQSNANYITTNNFDILRHQSSCTFPCYYYYINLISAI